MKAINLLVFSPRQMLHIRHIQEISIWIKGFLEFLFKFQNHFNCKTSLETYYWLWKLLKYAKLQFIDLPGIDTACMRPN